MKDSTVQNGNYPLLHTQAIKQRLLEGKKRYEYKHGINKITSYRIHHYLKDERNYEVSIPTLDKILDPKSDLASINATTVVELCKWWNIDLSYVFALPEDRPILRNLDFNDNNIEEVNAHLGSYNNNFKQITDDFYMGDFVCYMLKTSYVSIDVTSSTKNDSLRKNDALLECPMTIKNINGNIIAEMVINNKTDKDEEPHQTKLSGIPVHLTKSNNIYINFVSDDGRYYTIMYDYQIFYNAPMYYREAIVLTSTTGAQPLPLISKMAIFRNPVPKQYHPYLLGLLSLNVQNIIISEDQFDKLKEDHKEIKKFADEYSEYLALCKRKFYAIPESMIGTNPLSTMSPNDLKKVFLLLRNHSYSLAQIEVGNDSKASVIAKEIQNYELPF